MLEEIKRYNTIGDLAGISYFTEIVLTNDRIQKTAVQKLCDLRNNIRVNLKAAISYYKYMGLITEKDFWLYPTEQGKALIESECFEDDFCKICICKIINDGLLDMESIHYSRVLNTYYIEKFGIAVSAALFRNILLQYKALKDESGVLVIGKEYEYIFAEFQKKTKLSKSLEKLKEQLTQQEVQGETAELYVLEYEKNRISCEKIKDKIKRISIIDVAAGYDIISFESASSEEYDRFIEVKSYVGNPHFYWSKNEIETAKLYGDKYYVYLVDTLKIDNDEYVPQIICNPASSILESEKWIVSPTSFLVMPIE